jgi:signal transduction histidine kinase
MLRQHGRVTVVAVDSLAAALATDAEVFVVDEAAMRRLATDDVEALRRVGTRRPGVLLVADALDDAALERAESLGFDDWFETGEAPASVARRLRRCVRPSPRATAETQARQRVERTLEHVERFARLGCYDYSADDGSCVATEALRQMLGLPADSPTLATTFFERVHPEDQARVAEAARVARSTGVAVEVEHRILRADTGEERQFISVIEAETDAAGALLRLRGLSQDVSARWQSAADRFAAQKLQAVGQLASGVAHDFNNLLAVVLLNATVLQSALALDADQTADLEDIVGAARRGKALVRQLQAFSERSPAPDTPFDLSALVRGLGDLLCRLVQDGIELALETPVPAPVRGDPGELEQVVVNLVMNARDALPAGGVIVIRVDAGDTVGLTVSDSGHGMPPDALPHLFEPFYTTKSLGDGPGLGLAAVHGIVRRHGGRVEVRSSPGRGTVIEVRLPRRRDP